MGKGKVIVLEGLDGSGKSTQLDLAVSYLKENGVNCRKLSFPNYDSVSGMLVEGYLKGEISCDGRNGAYAASVIYAIDRYTSCVADWKEYYESGGVIVSGRYTTSNAIYQLTKVPEEERGEFLDWLFDLEYNKMGLPKPDMVIFLDMPVEVSQKLIEQRYLGDSTKKDIHEKNVGFLRECRKNALTVAERFKWEIISCADKTAPRSIEDIFAEICTYLRVLLFK